SLTTVDLPVARKIGERAFHLCPILTLRLGYNGTITFSEGFEKLFGLAFDDRANTIDLYLHPSQIPTDGSTSYGGYTWQSIQPYQ
ncbi:MAG: hypothetical protein LBD64_06030, partial [Odoribacteraceae bacterium]|nr:hypothetical protein [Odoribacteraceae bacterium]